MKASEFFKSACNLNKLDLLFSKEEINKLEKICHFANFKKRALESSLANLSLLIVRIYFKLLNMDAVQLPILEVISERFLPKSEALLE